MGSDGSKADSRMATLQSVAGFVGLTLGVVPLVSSMFRGNLALWSRVLPEEASWGWVAPALTLVLALGVVIVVERRK